VDKASLGHAGRQGLVVVAIAQRHEIADPCVEERVDLGPADADVAFQQVGVGEAVGGQVAVIGNAFDLEGQVDATTDVEAAIGEDMAAHLVLGQIVPGDEPAASIRPVRKACL
jgi:hypothetical protein